MTWCQDTGSEDVDAPDAGSKEDSESQDPTVECVKPEAGFALGAATGGIKKWQHAFGRSLRRSKFWEGLTKDNFKFFANNIDKLDLETYTSSCNHWECWKMGFESDAWIPGKTQRFRLGTWKLGQQRRHEWFLEGTNMRTSFLNELQKKVAQKTIWSRAKTFFCRCCTRTRQALSRKQEKNISDDIYIYIYIKYD